MYKQLRLKRTTIITYLLGLFLAGLLAARVMNFTGLLLATVAILTVSLYFLKISREGVLWSLLLGAVFLMGVYRGSVFKAEVKNYDMLFNKQVLIKATAREDSVYSKKKQLEFSATSIEFIEPNRRQAVGNIHIEGFGAPMIYRGDRVLASGKLYKRRGDNIAGISFANITIIGSNSSIVDKLRRRFAAGLQNVLPEPLSSLGLGLLIGQRSTLPDDLTEALVRVSLIHIVAVSGYNLTIIIYAAMRLLKKRSRFQALVASGAIILLFLLVTGFSPSIARAAVVSVVSLIMWYFGRSPKPLIVLLLAAVTTTAWNPLYIWTSVGWYLSFAAFFGILVLAPLIHQLCIPSNLQGRLLPAIFTETLAAQICTLPILLYIFSKLPIIGIIANILVIPFVPFAMLATLIAGLYGMVGPFLLGGILVLPAKILLSYMVAMTRLLSRFHYASIDVKISWLQTVILCLIILAFIIILNRKKSQKLTSKSTSLIVFN